MALEAYTGHFIRRLALSKTTLLVRVYRNAPLFVTPRDASCLEVWRVRVYEDLMRVASSRLCDYRKLFGGRSRCVYQPASALAPT